MLFPNSSSSAGSSRLIRAVGTISFFTFLSRISGFIRDVVVAHSFGAGMGADAFFVALKLPNFLRRLFAEGAFSTAFVPVFSDYIVDESGSARHAAQSVFTVLSLALVGVVVIGQIVMPLLIMVLAPGFADDPGKYQLTVDLTRVTFPYIFFISLVALAGGILNSYQHFAVPAATPILLNVSLIVGALFLAPHLERPTMGLAIGVLLGGISQLVVQLPALAKIGLPFAFRWNPGHPAIHRILTLMGPSLLGVSVAQINLLFDLFLASWLPEGSISYLYYADRLVEFPLGIIGIALATAILPVLSAKAAKGDWVGLKSQLDFGLRLMLVINLPATVGLIALRGPILSILFERGAFDAETTRLTGQAVLAFGVGLIAFSTVKIVAPAFYAMKDTRTPVRVAIICMVTNMVLNLLFIIPLKHAGLALATSLSAFLNTGLLLYHLRSKIGYQFSSELKWTVLKASAASLVMWVALWGAETRYWSESMATADKMLFFLPTTLGAGLLYMGLAWVLRMQEFNSLLNAIRRKK